VGGKDAARGFEYQYLRTLEYALLSIASGDTELTAVQIEGVLTAELKADQEIVDFALASGERVLTVAQVKSGGPGSSMSASDLMEMLLRLLSHAAERYLVVTNRSGASNLRNLLTLMKSGKPDICDEVLSLIRQSKISEELPAAGDEFWKRLRRTEVVLDPRDIEQLRADVQELVRTARHRVAPSSVGWGATGLLTGYLVWEVMARAAGPQGPELTMTELLAALRMDADELKSLMRERDWAVPVTPAPRATDIARPELLARIAEDLPVPVPRDAAPVCLLTGLSGIGKSSLAAAWADDNAYAYAMIMWIDATSESQIMASFNTVAARLQANGLAGEGEQGAPVRQRVFAALARSARPWLMVFDNCSDQAVVREWIPPRGHGHTIVTSTDQTPLTGPSIAKIDVRGMTDAEATRLLTVRLLGGREPNDNEQESLQQLAARLHHWPLALELAASYLVSTQLEHAGDLTRAVADFEDLLARAMDDRPSVPVDYPDTVVGAITMTWRRIVGRTGPAETMAANALRTAAFLATRQIPLHLLLACAVDEVDGHFPRYTQHDPPIGEVLRAVRRDSLATVDEPFPVPTQASRGSTRSLDLSITMNDIVQSTVRGLVDREERTAEVLLRATFCTQAWLQFFSSNHEMQQAVGMVGHAVELSEHAIEHATELDLVSQASALLWGNTAGILGYLDEWEGATRYLSAELACLDLLPEADVIHLRIQTLVTFARALYELADHPRDAVEQIVPLLERFIVAVPNAIHVHEQAAGESIRVALATVRNLRLHSVDHPRLTALESALNDFRRMVPIAGDVDWYDELTQLNATIRKGRDAEARAKAEAMLATMNPTQPAYPQVLRMMAELCVSTRDWPGARDILTRFSEAAQSGTLRRFDIATLVRNLGTGCIFAMADQDAAAFECFDAVIRIAEIADRNRVVIQAGDRDVISVLRALHAYLNADNTACRTWLDHAHPNEIDSVERTGISNVVRRLLRNWCADKTTRSQPATFTPPDEVVDWTNGVSPVPMPDTVHAIDEKSIRNALLKFGAESAPGRAIASVQVTRTAGRPPRDPIEVAAETCLALRMLGLPTQIAETALQVLRDGAGLELDDPERFMLDYPTNVHACRVPHHVAWVTSSGHLVDPVVPQLYAFRAVATTLPSHRHPVVAPSPTTRHFPVVRRDGLLVAYQHLGSYDVHDIADVLPPERRTACETNALFVALQALVQLAATGDHFISAIEGTHPQLEGLIIRPERLIEATEAKS
jgi:hypothetical protein